MDKANKIFLWSMKWGWLQNLSVIMILTLAFIISALSKSFLRVGFPCKYFKLDSFFPVCNNNSISLDGVLGDSITTFLFPCPWSTWNNSLQNVFILSAMIWPLKTKWGVSIFALYLSREYTDEFFSMDINFMIVIGTIIIASPIKIIITIRPISVSGYMSPYPIVVTVVIMKYKKSWKLIWYLKCLDL